MRAVVVSLSTARQAQVLEDLDSLVQRGAEVDLIVTKPEAWEVDDRIRVHGLADREASHPLLRLERTVVLTLPRVLYGIGRRVLAVLARVLPGPAGRRVGALQGRWKRAWTSTRDASRRFHKERWGSWYADVRPWFLWRVARRGPVRGLTSPADVVVVADSLSVPIGWQLARRWPQARVGFSLDEALSDVAGSETPSDR